MEDIPDIYTSAARRAHPFAMQSCWDDNSLTIMALIKLHKANEAGEDEGVLFINTDQIIAITVGPSATELQMADGRTRWAKDTPDQIALLAKTSG
jgi:hypothetical protein